MVVPCIVKIWLYCSAVRTVPSGVNSWALMRRASTPPHRNQNMATAPYIMPIFLWSTVKTHARQPLALVGRANAPVDVLVSPDSSSRISGRSSVMAIGIDLLKAAACGSTWH